MSPSEDSPFQRRHHEHQAHPNATAAASPNVGVAAHTRHSVPSSPSSTPANICPFMQQHTERLDLTQSAPSPDVAGPTAPQRPDLYRKFSCSLSDTTSQPMSRAPSVLSAAEEDEVILAIKCPSLDRDSTLMKFKADTSILQVKQTIEQSWPGKPRAQGMRCIRAGRLLQDTDVLEDLIQGLENMEPVSLHLVIRPDAWSDPQSRPTASRRSSYLRQQISRSSPLTNQVLVDQALQELTAGNLASNTTASSPVPSFAPYFSDPPPQPQLIQSPQAAAEATHASADIQQDCLEGMFSEEAGEACSRLEQTLRITAPENYPMLIESLTKVYDEYVLMYEDIYKAASVRQNTGIDTASKSCYPGSREVLDLIEAPLLGWSPVSTDFNVQQEGDQLDKQFYHQTSFQGLPYLIRLTSSSVDLQRSEAMYRLLVRLSVLRNMMRKIENLILLDALMQRNSAQTPIAPAAAAMLANYTAMQAGRQPRSTSEFLTAAFRTFVEAVRSITFQDVSEVLVPVFFLVLKVGILLYVMIRHADPFKKYFILGASVVYVAWESWRIVRRRLRIRRPGLIRAATPAPPRALAPAQIGQDQPQQPQVDQARNTGVLGANVPRSSSDEESAERQVEEDPFQPLPAPRAPPRYRGRTRFTLDWLLEQMSFIGMDAEDLELGLLPSSEAAATQLDQTSLRAQAFHTVVLPCLLFLFTMVPEVEQRRKRAIEERERVIRKWSRLEQERQDKMRERMKQITPATQASSSQSDVAEQEARLQSTSEIQVKRDEYADRILRRRRGTEAADVDDGDQEAIQRALRGEDDEEVDEMNIF